MSRSNKSLHKESLSSLRQAIQIADAPQDQITLAEFKAAAHQAQQAASTLWRLVGIKEAEEDLQQK